MGAAIALLVFLPNLIWQATHDWISVQYVLSHRGHTDGPFAYWWQQVLVFFNPLFVVPAVAGLVTLHRDDRFRALVYASIVVLLIFFVMGGKSYARSSSSCWPPASRWASTARHHSWAQEQAVRTAPRGAIIGGGLRSELECDDLAAAAAVSWMRAG